MKAILTTTLICLSILLFGQTKEDSIRWQKLAEQRISAGQDSVYQQLLRAKQPENYLNPPSLSYSSAPYYTEASRQLLLDVLQDDWITEEQKREEAYRQVWRVIDQQITSYQNIITDTVKYSRVKSKHKRLKVVVDSLKSLKQSTDLDTAYFFQQQITSKLEEFVKKSIPNQYVYTAGMLGNDPRFIQLLQEALKDSIKFDPYAVKMSLARNDIGAYAEEMLEKNRIETEWFKKDKFDSDLRFYENNEAFPNLAYLNTQESIKEYSKLLAIEHFEQIDGGDYTLYSIPVSVLIGLSNLILNPDFQEYLRQVDPPNNVTKDHITWVQNWLEENYGNYELERDFYPGLR